MDPSALTSGAAAATAHNLSVWGLFMAADIVVKAVMLMAGTVLLSFLVLTKFGFSMNKMFADAATAGSVQVLLSGPTPVEHLLHALAGCLTAGIANIAAARGVTLHSCECMVEGDMDLRGILGLSDEVRNGFRTIRMSFDIKGDAPAETLKKIVEQSRARSAVFDILTNGVPVSIAVNA